MKGILSPVVLAAALLCPLASSVHAEPPAARSLFDGKTLDGWKVQSGFATYKVEDGAIIGTTALASPNTFLVYKDEFADFELEFDVKLLNKELNSGVQIRSHLPGGKYGGHLMGPQCEIEASPGQSGWIYGEALSTGWLSPEPNSKDKKVNQQSLFKNGEWNHFRIVAKGAHIETFINGTKVADLNLPEKLAAKHAKGLVGLQVHAVGKSGPFQVMWKNIAIREL
jgi:hypothetical protein